MFLLCSRKEFITKTNECHTLEKLISYNIGFMISFVALKWFYSRENRRRSAPPITVTKDTLIFFLHFFAFAAKVISEHLLLPHFLRGIRKLCPEKWLNKWRLLLIDERVRKSLFWSQLERQISPPFKWNDKRCNRNVNWWRTSDRVLAFFTTQFRLCSVDFV